MTSGSQQKIRFAQLRVLWALMEGQRLCYFGAIAGVRIPDGFGQVVFFGGLTVSLWIVGGALRSRLCG